MSSPNPDDALPLPSVLIEERIPGSPSSFPAIHLESVHRQRRSETSSVSPPSSLDIGDRLLILTAVFIDIDLKLVCPDRMEGHSQVCRVLGVLAPIFLEVHIGIALVTFGMLFIPPNGGNAISLRRLWLVWAVLFALGLFCTVIQISLYAWTIGNPVTAITTALLAILCSLPGFYIVGLIWNTSVEAQGY